RRGRAAVVGGAGRVTASTRPRMQAAQPISHSSQKMPESPGSSARTNPGPPQTNSPTTLLVFHFFPMTGLSLMRLGAGRARLPVSGCDRSVTPRYPAPPARTSPDATRWACLRRPRQRTNTSPWRSVATGPRFTGKDTSMGKLAWQIIGVGAPIAAAFVARKTLTFAWEKSTKRPAPSNPVDDEISMSEALAWTIVSGVGVAVAQLV